MSIRSFEDIKNEKGIENFGGDVVAWSNAKAEENEMFRGITLNARKKERLDSMAETCRKIAEIEPVITSEWVPFSTKSRNSVVKLVVHEGAFVTDQRTMALLGALYTNADDAVIIASGDDVILSFGIRDMWDEFRYEGD